jgi:hypothetical protein
MTLVELIGNSMLKILEMRRILKATTIPNRISVYQAIHSDDGNYKATLAFEVCAMRAGCLGQFSYARMPKKYWHVPNQIPSLQNSAFTVMYVKQLIYFKAQLTITFDDMVKDLFKKINYQFACSG